LIDGYYLHAPVKFYVCNIYVQLTTSVCWSRAAFPEHFWLWNNF